jgi:hypothetical protein
MPHPSVGNTVDAQPMKVFGARADEVGTVLALENTDFFCFLSGLNFFTEARYSLHVVRFFRPRETHSMMTIGDARTKPLCTSTIACRIAARANDWDRSFRNMRSFRNSFLNARSFPYLTILSAVREALHASRRGRRRPVTRRAGSRVPAPDRLQNQSPGPRLRSTAIFARLRAGSRARIPTILDRRRATAPTHSPTPRPRP